MSEDVVEFKEMPLEYMRYTLFPTFQEEHWEEVGRDKRYKPDMHWKLYEAMEQANMLSILVMFINGAPEGYFVGIVSDHMHYKTMRLFVSDMFYVSKTHRAKYGVKLFRAAEDVAKSKGAHKMHVIYKMFKDITPIMKRLRYVPTEIIAVKNLDSEK